MCRPYRFHPVRLALLAGCMGAAAAHADVDHGRFQVRLQVLSTCHVAIDTPASPPDAQRRRALAIRCSRNTPFAIGQATPPAPRRAATGHGMDTVIGTSWPLHDLATPRTRSSDQATAANTLHIDY